MSYTKEREEFIARVTQEGLPVYVIRDLLAKANTLQRIAELSCSSEAADRDRVPCPGLKREADCCCERMYTPDADGGKSFHFDVPRIDRQEARIRKALLAKIANYAGFGLDFQGDPRGYVLKLIVPCKWIANANGEFENCPPWVKTEVGVPSRGLPASYWERH